MRVVYFFWSLPINIMKSGFFILNTVSRVSKKSTPRRRPLHTFGASILAIAHNASTQLQEYDSPLGSIAKIAIKFFNLFFPLVYTMLHQWLAMLSFMDDQILTVENTVETLFPRSKRLFDKIDGLVCNAETLPEQVDGFITKLPMFLNWLKNFLFNITTHLGSMLNIITREKKETKIDENPKPHEVMKSQSETSLHENDHHNAACSINRLFSLKNIIKTIFDEPDSTTQSPVFSDCLQDEGKNRVGQMDSPSRLTYKEILEVGTKANDDNNIRVGSFLDEKKAEMYERRGKYNEDGRMFKDQVEELSKASWHLMM